MRRRDVIRRIGTASVVAAGTSGLAAGTDEQAVQWEFDDGHVERFTLSEFDDHPDTPTVAAVRAGDQYELQGCCDCGYTGDRACPGCLSVCDSVV